MVSSKRMIDGIMYEASEKAFKLFFDPDVKDDGCGINLLLYKDYIPNKYDDLLEAFEMMRHWGTKPFGADFSVACRLHDLEFTLKTQYEQGSVESSAALKRVNESFYRNLERAREGSTVRGWRKYMMRWRWYRKARDSALRRTTRLYKMLVDKVGSVLWHSV